LELHGLSAVQWHAQYGIAAAAYASRNLHAEKLCVQIFFANVSFICFKMITFAAEFSPSPEKQTGERA
jgi:hypothetical protein